MDPDELFVQGAAQNRAKVVCATCPVRTECLADALDNRVEYGVWGGMTERERRALLRRRPEVRSWRQVLEEKRDAYFERTGTMLMVPEPGQLLPQQRDSAESAEMAAFAQNLAKNLAQDLAQDLVQDLAQPTPVG